MRFPLQSRDARKEVLIGAALLLFLPGIGWLLNMGHRIRVVHNMQHGRPPWPAWNDYPQLLWHGLITFFGMVYYGAPGLIALGLGLHYENVYAIAAGVVLGLAAVVAIPGYMSHYCVAFDAAEIYDPFRALRRVAQGGRAYWHAWAIALTAMALSFVGLLGFGVFFFVTSVWFWQVAGFSFARVFTERFELG